MNRDLEPAGLKQPRGGETHRSATDDRDRPGASAFHNPIDGQTGRPPRQGDATAAVPVVVHEELVAERLRLDAEPRRAKRPKTDDGADDALRKTRTRAN